jgi:hypothetical protein
LKRVKTNSRVERDVYDQAMLVSRMRRTFPIHRALKFAAVWTLSLALEESTLTHLGNGIIVELEFDLTNFLLCSKSADPPCIHIKSSQAGYPVSMTGRREREETRGLTPNANFEPNVTVHQPCSHWEHTGVLWS